MDQCGLSLLPLLPSPPPPPEKTKRLQRKKDGGGRGRKWIRKQIYRHYIRILLFPLSHPEEIVSYAPRQEKIIMKLIPYSTLHPSDNSFGHWKVNHREKIQRRKTKLDKSTSNPHSIRGKDAYHRQLSPEEEVAAVEPPSVRYSIFNFSPES